MDVFKFEPLANDIILTHGELVKGIKTVTWIERYLDAGEFTITADVESGIREVLPIGSLISHMHSFDVMIVESHEISDARTEELEVTITGRSLETILEQRIVGTNQSFPAGVQQPIVLPAQYTWVQAVSLINQHINPAFVIDPADALPGFNTYHYVNNTPGQVIAREVKVGSVYSNLMDLLAEDQLGITVVRPMEVGETTTKLVVYDGVDLRSRVIFSFDAGDITNADYLWSNKNDKNSILVVSKWAQHMVKAGSGYNRRVDVIDAKDIDEHLNDPPDAGTLASIQQSLINRGNQVLRSRNMVSLSKAQAAKNAKKYLYRRDFKIGDIVLIDGMFNESAAMRVTEYVEVYDKDGMNGYPTLSTWPEVS
jgi:hypothetical protein